MAKKQKARKINVLRAFNFRRNHLGRDDKTFFKDVKPFISISYKAPTIGVT
jgi:hypothetical protein